MKFFLSSFFNGLTLAAILLSFVPLSLLAQQPGSGFGDPSKMNIGHFYGKVVDENGKGVGYATVQLSGKKFDPATKTLSEGLISGQLTLDNGDFSLTNLPVAGEFTLKVSYLGYAEMEKTVSFGVKPPQGGMPQGAPTSGGSPGAGMNFDIDLGNIVLKPDSKTLAEVTITGEASGTTLALDRKVYRVDKDASATGGNAQDALKNVPSLSVDIDGNVSLRNGAPQIFVDGRPTTLSLQQISADAIESVEVITNPSAKFDAGGGTAGIVNIVLKKERRIGYNGNVRAGTDSRAGFNLGGDVNARGEKINLFASGNLNQGNGFSTGETYRQNLYTNPLTNLTQITDGENTRLFVNGRAGIDWFMDNRNTITFSGSYMHGDMQPNDVITTTIDTLLTTGLSRSVFVRNSDESRNFMNTGGTMAYKHLFPKAGAEWTADLNFNRVKFVGNSDYQTNYSSGSQSLEKQESHGTGQFMTFQSDFVNPISDKVKIEGGVRAALRSNTNDNANYFFNQADNDWVQTNSLSDHYKFSDNVYAAYGTYSQQFKRWGYQVGLRAESSIYTGALTDRDSSFSIAYPISLFPSGFLTYKLNDLDNIQLAYTRRVNRPNFFQTMPFTDFADSLNLRRGNPQLLPEFTNSVELSYQNIFTKGHNILISLYYKQATDLITSYQFSEYNADLGKEVIITSYANSNYSAAYGVEFTSKNTVSKWLDMTTNLNVYQSRLDASNVENSLVINRMSWFLKENMQFKLPAGFNFQLSGEYRSKASFTPNEGNRMPWQPGPTNTAQGYTLDNWFVDAALRYDFLQRKASLTLAVNDIFRTRRNGTYTSSDLFIQEAYRYRDPQVARLNFSYRFGKMDSSLFKRKNMKMNMQGNDMM
ncbi:MAG: outer membrane beta-barrel protein [Lewinellaceae bacterium]|nr:outer membrane beta-barrel protein [Lewinellaceae bacterium]